MVSRRDPPQKKNLCRLNVKGWKKNIPRKWTCKKKRWDSNTYIRETTLQNKNHKKRPRRTLHNTQGKNTSRRHKHYKYIYTQQRNTEMHKENFGGLQERYRQQDTCSRGFNTPLSKMDRSSKQNMV